MASKRTIMAKSAYPTSKKRHVLVEEAMRRLRNCSPQQPWHVKADHLTTLALEMQTAGHKEHFRETVLSKAANKYKKELAAHMNGTKDMYRSRKTRELELEAKGGKSDKSDWMKRMGSGCTTTLKLPGTKNGQLMKDVESQLRSCPRPDGTKEKVVEESGRMVRHEICPSDPFPRQRCHRANCVPDNSKEGGVKGQCYASNCNYLFKCRRCEVELADKLQNWTGPECGNLKREVYRGETSRPLYTRAQGHLTKYRAKNNFMWEHTRDHHGGVLGPNNGQDDYVMEMESKQKTSFARQVRESILIKRNKEGKDKDVVDIDNSDGKRKIELDMDLFNGRGEWFAPKHVEVFFNQL